MQPAQGGVHLLAVGFSTAVLAAQIHPFHGFIVAGARLQRDAAVWRTGRVQGSYCCALLCNACTCHDADRVPVTCYYLCRGALSCSCGLGAGFASTTTAHRTSQADEAGGMQPAQDSRKKEHGRQVLRMGTGAPLALLPALDSAIVGLSGARGGRRVPPCHYSHPPPVGMGEKIWTRRNRGARALAPRRLTRWMVPAAAMAASVSACRW